MADEAIPEGAVLLKAGEVKVIHDVASLFHMPDAAVGNPTKRKSLCAV